MRVSCISIKNLRGIKSARLLLPKHGVLVGDNNTGKTTVLEALDLALGPDRLSRQPPVDEHDFFQGRYAKPSNPTPSESPGEVNVTTIATAPGVAETESPMIEIGVTVVDLSEVQKATFGNYIEFWCNDSGTLYAVPNPEGVDATSITEALRVTFHGWYSEEEDDFEGKTYFTRSLTEEDKPEQFTKKHKQVCGFLYLRSVRTGSRALSLERGSLLDIILRLKEVRPLMWEDALNTLSGIAVASNPDLGITPVLESINTALKKYVPKEWGVEPHLKVSNLTREHLRKVITAFIATGDGKHAAPFYRQGTGTINMLVLALLSQIAESKQNVIFAMEEPETAIPPYAQKRIVHEVRSLASQTIFTSHSPYVLEEFSLDETLILTRHPDHTLEQHVVTLPDTVKTKRYRQEFRTRFCEGLLARRILIAEGATEASAFPVVCRRLSELNPQAYSSLEALGICTIDAGSETNIAGMAKLYKELGKRCFAICDKQNDASQLAISEHAEVVLMHQEKGFENMVLKGTTTEALTRFTHLVDWPQHLAKSYPKPADHATDALREYFSWAKGNWGIADFLAQCSEAEIPEWLRNAAAHIKTVCSPPEAVSQELQQPDAK